MVVQETIQLISSDFLKSDMKQNNMFQQENRTFVVCGLLCKYTKKIKIKKDKHYLSTAKFALFSHISSLPSFLPGAFLYPSATQAISGTYCTLLEKSTRKLTQMLA